MQQYLITSGIGIKAAKSYRNDIENLCRQSRQTLNLLKELSIIRVGDTEVKIRRRSTEILITAAEENSIVVAGEPGAGKSGALHDFAQTLIEQNRDVIFFAVDHLEARSVNELRNELTLEHDIIEIMKNWSNDRPAFLIIDALDAARSESAAQTFYDLISLTFQNCERWRIITSIRKFDLRHHVKLRRLFAGVPPTEFRADEFYNLCHFIVPLLSDDELLQVPSQSMELDKLIVGVENSSRLLLKVPFNLRLAGDLIGSGVSAASLSPIKTQIGLLDRYWEERVVRNDSEGDARQAVLQKVVEAMVETRTLRANRRSVVTKPSNSRTLNQLLSSHIISEWEAPGGSIESNVLTFAHHVLFDYATSILLFRGRTESLVQTLENNVDLVLAVRPSIVLYFQHLWQTDYGRFWEAYFNVIKSDQIPEVGKLTGATVIVENTVEMEKFSPLIDALSSEDIYKNELAEKAFRHLTGALLVIAAPGSALRIIGENAPPWCEILDRCTNSMTVNLAYSVRPLLWTICAEPALLGAEQLAYTGSIARRLLKFALSKEIRDPSLVLSGIETVCKTFETDLTASAELLRKCLEPQHVQAYGHEELFHFAQQVERLSLLAPDLVQEMYTAAFTNYDDSEDKTYALASRILPLTSTRRQDFEMARYSFARQYSKFLDAAPLQALQALLAAINSYVDSRNKNRFWGTETLYQETGGKHFTDEERFNFDGQEAFVRTDYSSIWDDSFSSRDHHPIQMLNDFGVYLEKVSSDDEQAITRRNLINLIVRENKYAVIWRRLIVCGTKYPNTLGYEIRSLAWAKSILTTIDTTVVIGNFISQIFSTLTKEERYKIEQEILSISDSSFGDEQPERSERQRNRLLGCLNKDAVISEKVRELIEQLESEKNIPPNKSPFISTGFSSSEFTDEDYLKEQGVSLDDEKNRRIFDLSQPAKIFAGKHQNSAPTSEEFALIIPHLRALYEALMSETDNIHEKQRDMAWGDLADACASAVELEDWSCELKDSGFIKTVLLECADYAEPPSDSQMNEQFEEHPFWSPAARIDAASGLIRLARHASCLDANVIAKIKQLGLDDAVPAVRFQIATNLVSLYSTSRELMWFLLENITASEQRNGILSFLVNGPLNRLAGHHPDEVTNLTKNIFERVQDRKGSDEVRRHCASIFLGLYLWQNQNACNELVREIVSAPAPYSTEVYQIVFDLRNHLNLGLQELGNQEKEKIRAKAFGIMNQLLISTAQTIGALEKKYEFVSFDGWTEEDQKSAKDLARLAESGELSFDWIFRFKRNQVARCINFEIARPRNPVRFFQKPRPKCRIWHISLLSDFQA